MIFDPSGKLYGTTQGSGDPEGAGNVFEMSPLAGGEWSETVLHSFSGYGYGGAFPQAGVIRDSSGHLCGTTFEGGQETHGTVFEVTP